MKALIVTADDFGLASEVNEAVELAHRDGILTAASLMVTGPGASDAVRRARRMPSLRVGLHLVLLDGVPVLPADRIPALVDDTGNLRTDMLKLAIDIALRPAARRQLAAEIEAQFAAYRATGLPLDHVNTHHHFHVHPVIAAQVVNIGQRFGMKALRVPVESTRVLDRVEPSRSHRPDWVTAPWCALLRSRLRARTIATADRVFGMTWSGAMTRERTAGLLRNLPDGTSEMYFHPATAAGFAGSAEGYAYAEELAALVAPEVKELAARSGARSGGFADVAMP